MVNTMKEWRRSVVKPTFRSDEEYITESNELAGIEIKMNKSRVTEDVPIHFANCILQWSKVLFYR